MAEGDRPDHKQHYSALQTQQQPCTHDSHNRQTREGGAGDAASHTPIEKQWKK